MGSTTVYGDPPTVWRRSIVRAHTGIIVAGSPIAVVLARMVSGLLQAPARCHPFRRHRAEVDIAPAADTRRVEEAGIGDCAPRGNQIFTGTDENPDMPTPAGG
jgi:hypothetical protein